MNQAASATRRSPAGSAATASCCPMFNTPFFVNTFTPQTPLLPPPTAQPCFLGTQSSQHAQISTTTNQQQRSQQQNVVLQNQQTVSQLSANGQSQQAVSQQPQDHTSNYSTTISPPNLSLQQLFTGRPSPTSCMALAAALAASATFPHFHHQQQPPTQNHQTPINQATTNTQNTSALNNVNPVTQANSATTTITNQVPILNFNSYSPAPPFLNLSAPAVPPTAAHLNSSTSIHHHQPQQHHQHQQQQNSITSANQTSTPNTTAPSTVPTSANEHQQRSVLNNQVNQQQQGQIYRNIQPVAQQQQQQQTQQQPSAPVQQLGQATRSILSDETLNNLFNDQFQAILLNQLFSNQQFVPPLASQTQPPPAQQTPAAPAPAAAARPQTLPSTGQVSVVMPPAQPIATQIISHQTSEPASDNQQQQQQAFQQHTASQTRIATVPPVPTINLSSGLFQPQQQTASTNQQQQHQATHNSNPLQVPQQTQQPILQQQQQQAPPPSHNASQQQQQTQPQSALPPMPFYSYPQMEQALALLTNPQVANNIFSHVFNIYLQSGLRSDPHQSHHHHHPPHHFHHHFNHGQHHHHHHHGPNSQGNGQDATMPLDSLAINETKPRGLNRAEIDSLTPYIHMNEKDSKTCVICLSKFELKSKIRPLPCNHAFHAKCVDKWLRANRTCPICRRDALRTYNAKIKRI